MNTKILSYKEIPFTGEINRAQSIKVELSKYQAFLFRKKIELLRESHKKSFMKDLIDKLKFFITLLAIFVTCPRVAFLSFFYDANTQGLEKIEFQKYGNNILVIFKAD